MTSDLDDTIALLGDLIAFPTVSSDPNLDLIEFLAARLTALGAECEIQHDKSGTKGNLFATIGPDRDGGVVLSGHTDVVPAEGNWTSPPFEMTARDGLLYGRGTCDMKGFIAAAVVQARHFARMDLSVPLHLAFTYDEEIGCLGGQVLVSDLVARGLKPSVAIIGEPTEMRVINGHKGCREVHTTFTGLEGHSSQPDKGVNALEYAIRFADKLYSLRETLKTRAPDKSPFDPPYTTLQVGHMFGGVATNVIAGSAQVEWDLRAVQDSDAALVDEVMDDYVANTLIPQMKAVSDEAGIETTIIGDVVGLTPLSDSEAVTLACALTGSNATDVVSFGTEAGIFQKAGISAVVCGPGSIAQAHKPDEFIDPAELAACLKMLAGLEARLTG